MSRMAQKICPLTHLLQALLSTPSLASHGENVLP